MRAAWIALAIGCAAPKPSTLDQKVATWRDVPTDQLAARVIGRSLVPRLGREAYRDMKRLGMNGTRMSVRLCVSSRGDEKHVQVRESSGSNVVDGDIVQQIERWQFAPGTNACTGLTIVNAYP